MDRHPFHANDRDARVAELTEQQMRAWNLRLQAGEQRAISDLHNVVLDRLTEADAAAVFVQVATDTAGAAARLAALTAEAMRAECEHDALKQIEAAEQALAEGRTADRIARAIENRVFA